MRVRLRRAALRSLLVAAASLALGPALAPGAGAEEPRIDVSGGRGRPVTIVVREATLAEVVAMLSRHEQVNVLLGVGVAGTVSVNLFEVTLDQAIRAIAESAGFVAERRRHGYVILPHKEAGQDSRGNTRLRTFKVQYSDADAVREVLEKHLSRYGEITALPARHLLVVEDLPEFLNRIENVLDELDREPAQILIEARVLEISLDETDAFGIDWSKVIESGDGSGSFGLQGLISAGQPGFFFDFMNSNIDAALRALDEKGRVRTLSTPTLMALEHEEAEVVVGDRLGYRVTTTINEITTESVEFLESGVILRFTASVDRDGRVLLAVHPEVSTGIVNDGLPEQTTAEVTTTLLADDGDQIFLGGLIKERSAQSQRGVPHLARVPILGRLFRSEERKELSSETVVVLGVYVMDESRKRASRASRDRLRREQRALDQRLDHVEEIFQVPYGDPPPAELAPGP